MMNAMLSKDNKFILNRELGLIEFYKRVLSKTLDKNIPILERLNYLCIVSKNCDELFEVRIARLLRLHKEYPNKILSDGLHVQDALFLVRESVMGLYDEIYNIYNTILIPELQHNDIILLSSNKWNLAQKKWLQKYFINELKPILTPISIDSSHPFPRVPNKNLHFAVELDGLDQYGRNAKITIVEAPRIIPRIIKLPEQLSRNKHIFVFLQDVIALHIHEFFYGLTVCGCYPFRVTRNAQINLKTDTKNLKQAISKEIHNRKYAACSRLEMDISNGIPDNELIEILLTQFDITHNDLYLAKGPVNLSRLQDLTQVLDLPDLKFPIYTPSLPKELIKTKNIFQAMTKGDILIHTPYQSFDPVIELTKQAALDPDVLAIKMTVYRTGSDSALAQNLIMAAKNGKQVIASIELFARFDEANNLELAYLLEESGAHVVYGVMGYKVHAKMLLIVRKEHGSLRQYVHLGTGNYHQESAKMYTDFGLLTTNIDIVRDVDNIFSQITGVANKCNLKIIHQAPFDLFEFVISKINQEIEIITKEQNSKQKTDFIANSKLLNARIIIKMNSLVENQVIDALYRASQAGIKIILIIRGACALKPDIKGVSDNIEVHSIVGRFLEHHRILYFYHNGAEDLYISSADWMKRNFFRRIETCIPILDKKIKTRIINEGIIMYLNDNVDSWSMDSNGKYHRYHGAQKPYKAFCAQQHLMALWQSNQS